MFINIHMLKSYSVSNLNRDRFNVPKTTFFGGVERGRRSSQNVKYTLRHSDYFRKLMVDKKDGSVFDPLCLRTRCVAEAIATVDGAKDLFASWSNDSVDFCREFAFIANTAEPKVYSADELSVMLNDVKTWVDTCFDDVDDLHAFFAWCRSDCVNNKGDFALKDTKKLSGKEKKWAEDFTNLNNVLKSRVGTGITLDIALFGRMVADDLNKRVDGAMRVSHFITTHAVMLDSDFFSALDDIDVNGAAHLGDVDYDTGVFYGYVGIDVDLLKRSLKGYDPTSTSIDEVIKAIILMLAMETSSSKQNSMASSPFPSVLCIEKIEENIPFTYENAFENPVLNAGEGFEIPSILRLKNEVESMAKTYDMLHSERFWLCPRDIEIDPTVGMNCKTLSDLLSKI